MFNLYPYTDFHELNLDMILRMMKDLHKEWTDFEAVNKITNAGAWDITKQYQAWTVVSDNNIGYISLKPVPAGVAITNTEYWGVIADYDILITDLSNRISYLEGQDIANKARISALENRRIIIMGDSYNASYDGTAGSEVTSVGDRIKSIFERSNCQIAANWAVGGAGFDVKSGTYTFNEYIDLMYGAVSDPDTITDFLLFGGYNETMAANYNAVLTGAKTFIGKVNTYFPKATVHLACVGWGTRSDSDMQKILFNAVPGYMDACTQSKNAVYVKNSDLLLREYKFCGSDGVHPTDVGYDYLAAMLGAYICNEDEINIYTVGYPATVTLEAGLSGALNLVEGRNNNITSLRLTSHTKIQGTFTFDSGNNVIIGDLPTNSIIYGFIENSRFSVKPQIVALLQYTFAGTTTTEYTPGSLIADHGKLKLSFPGVTSALTLHYVHFASFDLLLDTRMC